MLPEDGDYAKTCGSKLKIHNIQNSAPVGAN